MHVRQHTHLLHMHTQTYTGLREHCLEAAMNVVEFEISPKVTADVFMRADRFFKLLSRLNRQPPEQ